MAEPWLVGSNDIPSYAVNQLERWQASAFDPRRIDEELGWAEALRFNTMRVVCMMRGILGDERPGATPP